MATVVTLDRMIYTRTLTAETLGVGGRPCTATVTATGTDVLGTVTKASTVQISPISNMTEAELTAYQTFIGTLDEITTELEAALYVEGGG